MPVEKVSSSMHLLDNKVVACSSQRTTEVKSVQMSLKRYFVTIVVVAVVALLWGRNRYMSCHPAADIEMKESKGSSLVAHSFARQKFLHLAPPPNPLRTPLG